MPRINVVIAGDATKFKQAMRGVERDMRKTASQMQTIGGALFKTMGAPMLAIGTASVATAMKFERMEMGLKAIMGNAQDAEAELKKLTKTAQMPGVSLDQAIQGSVRLQAVGINADLARNAIQEFGNALAVSGGSAADLDGVILALTQMKGAGKILTQDLRQITTRIPMLAQVMKKQFGTDIPEEINKMGISFEEFSAKIIQGMQNEIPRATNTLENSFVNLRLAGEGLLAVIGKQLMEDLNLQGVVESLSNGLNSMAESFNELSPLMKGFIYGITGIGTILGGGLWVGGKIAFSITQIISVMKTMGENSETTRKIIIRLTNAMTALYRAETWKGIAKYGGYAAIAAGSLEAFSSQVGKTDNWLNRSITTLYTHDTITRTLVNGWMKLTGRWKDGAKEAENLKGKVDDLGETMQMTNEETTKFNLLLSKFNEAIKASEEATEKKKKLAEQIKEAYTSLSSELVFLNKQQKLYGGSLDPERINAYKSAIDTLLKLGYDPMSKAIQDLKKQVDELNEALAARVVKTLDVLPTQGDNIGKRDVEGNSLAPQIGNRLTDFGSINIAGDLPEIKDQNAALERQAELLRQLQSEFELGRQVGEQFGATLAQLATTGELSMKKLGRAAMVAAAQVVRAKLMQAVASYIADAFAKLGVLGGILAGASAGLVGGLFDAAISKIGGKAIPALAEGGMTTSAGYAMIGDNPSGKEFVIPYEKMGDFARRAMGGSNVNVTGEFRVKGTDLVLILERQNRLTTAKRGYGINA